MPRKKPHARPAVHHPSPAVEKAWDSRRASASQPPTVPARWLLAALGLVVLAAVACAWAALCLMFWQGNWQLLYHPTAAVTQTPASVGLIFDDVGFAATGAGAPRLKGWWIPADPASPRSRYTALYLHDATGNLGDTVGALARLHAAGLNVLAFDYRGYGQSSFQHPSEARWRQDTDWALQYLTGTRHVAANSILLVGNGLGANLALEVAAAHPELAGVVLQEPRTAAVETIFNDPRARLVPAHALVSDRWNIDAPAAELRTPSLWFYWTVAPGQFGLPERPEAFQEVKAPKMLVWLITSRDRNSDFANSLSQWLNDLPNKGHNLPVCQFSDGLTC